MVGTYQRVLLVMVGTYQSVLLVIELTRVFVSDGWNLPQGFVADRTYQCFIGDSTYHRVLLVMVMNGFRLRLYTNGLCPGHRITWSS